MTIIVRQFGFVPASGVLSNIVDGNVATGWAPAATDLASYTSPFLHPSGLVIVSESPCLEFDYGEDVRLPMFLLQTETTSTLGDGMLIGSNLPATSVDDVFNDSDILMGVYTQAQLCAGHVLKTAAFYEDIRRRYYRLLQHGLGVPITEVILSSTSSTIVDATGAGTFIVPTYANTLTIELWGGAACAGVAVNASNGADTTCSTYSLTAGGGVKSSTSAANSATGFGTGGVATGGNTANINGGNADPPSPTSSAGGFSGKGGDAPGGGGYGGTAVGNEGVAFRQGVDGQAPGGGGSGRNVQTSIAGGTYFKYPGGGAGAYVKHVFVKGVGSPPAAGASIAYSVGAGARSPIGDGHGANGRAKFSWN